MTDSDRAVVLESRTPKSVHFRVIERALHQGMLPCKPLDLYFVHNFERNEVLICRLMFGRISTCHVTHQDVIPHHATNGYTPQSETIHQGTATKKTPIYAASRIAPLMDIHIKTIRSPLPKMTITAVCRYKRLFVSQ